MRPPPKNTVAGRAIHYKSSAAHRLAAFFWQLRWRPVGFPLLSLAVPSVDHCWQVASGALHFFLKAVLCVYNLPTTP
jgi:hypothetical protein